MVHNCKAICIDYQEEYEKAKLKHVQSVVLNTPTVEKEQSGPFAKFKSYNTKQRKVTHKRVIVPEQCNHFRKCGTLNVWKSQDHASTLEGQWSACNISDTGMVWHKLSSSDNDFPKKLDTNQSLTYREWQSCKYKTA
jgi:hypothetical protein